MISSIINFGPLWKHKKKRADRMNRPEFYPQKLAIKFEAPHPPQFEVLLPTSFACESEGE
jgi:hypothetical protein